MYDWLLFILSLQNIEQSVSNLNIPIIKMFAFNKHFIYILYSLIFNRHVDIFSLLQIMFFSFYYIN